MTSNRQEDAKHQSRASVKTFKGIYMDENDKARLKEVQVAIAQKEMIVSESAIVRAGVQLLQTLGGDFASELLDIMNDKESKEDDRKKRIIKLIKENLRER